MKQPPVYAVILAGGSGTRFWPLSREDSPKQFLKMITDTSLLQQTLLRIQPLISPERMMIVTGERYRKQARADIRSSGLPVKRFLFEPSGKNTAPAICWAASRIAKEDPEAVMVVLPSDHLIRKKARFLKVLREAIDLARKRYLVTMGVTPTRPETGYGYLRIQKGAEALSVRKFTEKPDVRTAESFLKKGGYLWNSGMFAWRADVILDAFAKHLPEIHAPFHKSGGASVGRFWNQLPSISIDYGILEKASRVVAVEARDIGWSDLGSWESLTEVLPADKNGNILHGRVLDAGSRNTYVRAGQRTVAIVGLEDIVIVDTPDALLVCRKNRSQDVKTIVENLKNNRTGLNKLV